MALYIISYDLIGKKTIDDYETLLTELRRLGAKELLYSVWVWRTDYTSEVIRDHSRKFMHSNDRIVVAEITSNWASFQAWINMNQV